MGVYIPNMKKPKECSRCPCESDTACQLLDSELSGTPLEGIRPDCPLIEIDTDDPELSAFFEQLFPLLAELQRGSQVYDRSTRRKEN